MCADDDDRRIVRPSDFESAKDALYTEKLKRRLREEREARLALESVRNQEFEELAECQDRLHDCQKELHTLKVTSHRLDNDIYKLKLMHEEEVNELKNSKYIMEKEILINKKSIKRIKFTVFSLIFILIVIVIYSWDEIYITLYSFVPR